MINTYVSRRVFALKAMIVCVLLCFQTNSLYSQKPSPPVISASVTDVTETTLGSIQLNVSGGKTPYTYAWSTGSSSSSISGCEAGKYTVTVTDANSLTAVKTMYVQAAVIWTDFLNATSDGPLIEKENQSSDAWNSGAAGNAYFESNEDGMMSYITDAQSTHRFMGLAVPGNNMAWNSLSYSIYFMPGNALKIYESGVYAGSFGTYTAGDEFKIVKEGSTVKYYHGSSLMRTKTITSQTVLVPQVELYTRTAHFDEIKTSANKTLEIQPTITDVSTSVYGSIDLSISGGSSPYTYAWSTSATTQDITDCSAGKYTVTVTDNIGMVNIKNIYVQAALYWDTFLNATSDGPLVEKTSSLNSWNSGASSIPYFASNEDGKISHITDAQNTYRFMGLAVPGNNMAWNSLSYSFYFMTGNNVRIYELGVFAGSFGTFTPGEEFSIVKEGDKIKYYRGDDLLRVKTISTQTDLVPQVELYHATSHFDLIKSSAANSVLPLIISKTINPVTSTDLGSIDLTVTGGVTPYSYLWSGGEDYADLYNCWPGMYKVTVTDSIGITVEDSMYLEAATNWINTNNVTVNSNSIQKSNGTSAWDAGAESAALFKAGSSGQMVYTAESEVTKRAFGLSKADQALTLNGLNYGFYFDDNRVSIYENGVLKKNLSSYSAGDEFKILIENAYVKYYKDGVEERSVSIGRPVDLVPRSVFHTPQAQFTDIRTSGSFYSNFAVNTTGLQTGFTYDITSEGISSTESTGSQSAFWLNPIDPSEDRVFNLVFHDLSGQDHTFVRFEMDQTYVIKNVEIKNNSVWEAMNSDLYTVEGNIIYLHGARTSEAYSENHSGLTVGLENGETMSPDGDNNFDELEITTSVSVRSYQITITNTQGQEVYSSTDINTHWDGISSQTGSLVPQGTYRYNIIINDLEFQALFNVTY